MPGVLVKGKYERRPVYEFRGVKCREMTYDEYIVKEIERSYGMLDVAGSTVMDIGANIGAFTLWALKHEARQVIAFEPEPNNFEMLCLNTKAFRDIVIASNSALISGHETSLNLWVAPSGKNPGNSSLTARRGRTSVAVHAFNFKKMLERYQPSVIKMDVEGAEYDLLTEPLPLYVKQIAMEIHLNDSWMFDQAPELVEQFRGWKCIKKPVLDNPTLWQTLGAWKR